MINDIAFYTFVILIGITALQFMETKRPKDFGVVVIMIIIALRWIVRG